MNVLSTGELTRMQAANLSAMWDTCHIMTRVAGAVDDYGHPAITWTESITDTPCGLDLRNSYEVLGSTQVLVFDARARLPFGTIVTNLDRIKVTARYGVALGTALLFEIVGPPRQGPSGVQVDLKTATV
jgi:hypothetical protein